MRKCIFQDGSLGEHLCDRSALPESQRDKISRRVDHRTYISNTTPSKIQCLSASILCFEDVQQVAFDCASRHCIDRPHKCSLVHDPDLHLGATM